MCKTLPVLLLMGNSLRLCWWNKQISIAQRARKGQRPHACEQSTSGAEAQSRIAAFDAAEAAPFQSPLLRITRRFVLVDRGRLLQVDLLPFALDDAGANLSSGLAFLVLQVRVIQLLQAGRALGAVGVFEAAMQAVVPHAVAIAVARLLMQHVGNLRGQFIDRKS